MALNDKLVVAISDNFFNAFSRIPRNIQKKTSDFINKFRSNPTSSGINYESIINTRDRNMKSVRIDQDYRGIVHKPDSGNVYILLWVDHHDEAYEWARRKKCDINSETGSLQVYTVDEAQGEEEVKETFEGIFYRISDRHLLKMGVPKELVTKVKAIQSETELEGEKESLPSEAYEALTLLSAGLTPEEIIEELFTEEEVDETDYHTALSREGSKQYFIKLDDKTEDELKEMLSAPLEKWRVFLHRSQRKLVEKPYNGPARVLGGAGTGKTVVAMHRAKYLAKNISSDSGEKILFTTFTVNLAEDIKDNLRKITAPDVMKRIEVVNLDRWIVDFLRSQNYDYQIIYTDELKKMWSKAVIQSATDLPYDEDFYKEEWEKVVLPQNVSTKVEYIKATRVGRGIRLSRKDKMSVWSVFEEYMEIMNDKGYRDVGSAMKDTRAILKRNPGLLPYKSIVVDEGQDFGSQAYMLIREMVSEGPNDIFIVGDSHQRIYKNNASLSKCGINIRGRSSILKINYRTTEETRRWAFSLLKGVEYDDLDGGIEDGKGYRSLFTGPKPEVEGFDSVEREAEYIHSKIRELTAPSNPNKTERKDICIVARTKKLTEQYREIFSKSGEELYVVKQRAADDRSQDNIRIATMHRVKGLEFDHVFMVGINEGTVPLDYVVRNEKDKTVIREFEKSEKSLLYVAATRAKKALFVTSHGKMSRYVK